MSGRPRLKDVAAVAGVSTSTVARVLHGNGYAGEETRRSVEAALEQTGYQMDAIAQGLRKQRTSTIGHVLHGIIPNPFFASVAAGVEHEALARECAVLMVNTDGDGDRERIGVDALIRRRVDAMIFTVPIDKESIKRVLSAGIPVVQIERPIATGTPSVTVDNEIGARAAVEHLVELGHRRIAYIGANPARRSSDPNAHMTTNVERQRLNGYESAMTAHGIRVDKRLVKLRSYFSHGPSEPLFDGITAMSELLQLDERPTAVFAAADFFAAGALQAINAHGLSVPEEISVIGFDDTIAAYLAPPLTTVRQPTFEMGREAIRLLSDHLSNKGPSESSHSIRLSTGLIVRGSTAPPGGVKTHNSTK